MADIVPTPADVAPVKVFEQLTGPCAEAIDAGEVVRLDTSNGYFTLANAGTAPEARAVGVAMNSGAANETITVMVKGLIDFGDALTAEAYDEILELGNNDGKMDDGGTGTITKAIGRVVPSFGATTADKILFVDLSLSAV